MGGIPEKLCPSLFFIKVEDDETRFNGTKPNGNIQTGIPNFTNQNSPRFRSERYLYEAKIDSTLHTICYNKRLRKKNFYMLLLTVLRCEKDAMERIKKETEFYQKRKIQPCFSKIIQILSSQQ